MDHASFANAKTTRVSAQVRRDKHNMLDVRAESLLISDDALRRRSGTY
jgi:hypothetical protein